MAHYIVFISLYINASLKDYIYIYIYIQLTDSVYKHYMHTVYTN